MKGRLYTNVLLSLVMAVVITASGAAVLFRLFQLHAAPDRFERIGRAHALLISEVVTEKWNRGKRDDVRDFLRQLGSALNARFWMQDTGGRVFYQTAPPGPFFRAHEKDRGPYRIRHNWLEGRLEVIFPLRKAPLNGVEVHMMIERPEDGAGEFLRFFAVMGAVGGMLALLAIPLSRRLAAPLQELRQSAHRIAEGDLSRRAAVQSRGEIGELARDFNRMAERVEAMVLSGRHLTAHVSHELRSPLARLRLLAAMIEEDPSSSSERAQAMELEIEDMDRLIGAILEYSRAGMLREIPFEEVDLKDEVLSLVHRQEPVIKARGLRILTELPDGPVIFRSPGRAWRTFVGSLLDNAIKFSPEGTPIFLNLHTASEEKGIRFTIQNEYTGFSRHRTGETADLLKPFYRESDDAEGFGLGLATARAAAEAMGGTLSIDRRVPDSGERGEFTVSLLITGNVAVPGTSLEKA